jgi:hypothetical protein
VKRFAYFFADFCIRPCWKPDGSSFWQKLLLGFGRIPCGTPQKFPNNRLASANIEFIEIRAENNPGADGHGAQIAILTVKGR